MPREKLNVGCRFCDSVTPVMVDPADIERWRSGVLIQNAMPYLMPSERELFISGTCNSCWNEMFGHMEDEDE